MKQKVLNGSVAAVCVAAALFHLYVGGIGAVSSMTLRTIHWMAVVSLVFLLHPYRKGREAFRWFDGALLALALASALYVALVWPSRGELLTASTPLFAALDKVFGCVLVLVILEAARRTAGLALTLTAGLALLYLMVLGPRLPGILTHKGYSLARVMPYMMFTTEGVFGVSLGVSASFITLFVLFGSFLQVTGAGKFFIDIAYSVAGRFRGGPAKTAVVSSGLMGCISGSPMANVVTTGTFTIPLMVKSGYTPEVACAVEAVASTGGMLMPPMMGAAAFIMAEYLNVPYRDICVAAVVPAVMYYAAVFVIVDLEAAKNGLSGLPAGGLPDFWVTMRRSGHLILPLVGLIYCLMSNYSPQKTVFWSILALCAVSMVQSETRINWKKCVKAMKEGICQVVPVATACAAAGLVVGTISMTGLGVRFTNSIMEISGGRPLAALFFTMVAALILGMGLPAAAVYIVVSTVAAPALVNMGFSPMASHLFVFYFGIISTITPPVALTAYAAAGLAKGVSAIRVGLRAFLFGLLAFLMPYVFMYEPSFLLDAPLPEILMNLSIAALGLFFIAGGTVGYLFGRLNRWGRAACYGLGVGMIYPNLTVNIAVFAAGVLAYAFHKRLAALPVFAKQTRQEKEEDNHV